MAQDNLEILKNIGIIVAICVGIVTIITAITKLGFYINNHIKSANLKNYIKEIKSFAEIINIRGIKLKDSTLAQNISIQKIFIKLNFKDLDDKHFEIEELIQNKFSLIIGAPGSGKSTFLKYIAFLFITKQQKIIDFKNNLTPLFISVGRFVKLEGWDEPCNFFQLYTDKLWFQTLNQEILRKRMKKGKCIILFDGIDEVSDRKIKEKVFAYLTRLINTEDFQNNKIIATTRPLEIGMRIENFQNFYINPLNEELIEKYIQDWYAYLYVESPDTEYIRQKKNNDIGDLTSTIKKNEKIFELAQNPLLLTLLVLMYRYKGQLPYNRRFLYDNAVELILYSWEECRLKELREVTEIYERLKSILEYDILLKIIHNLAYFMHTEKRRFISDEELKTFLAKDKDIQTVNISDFIFYIQHRSGIIIENTNDEFSFLHLSFQEYLTALYIKKNNCEKDLLNEENISDSWWKEVFSLYYLLIEQKSDFLLKLVSLGEKGYILAFSCIKDKPDNDNKLNEQIIKYIISLYLETSDNERLNEIEQQLIYFNSNIYETMVFILKELYLQDNKNLSLIRLICLLKIEDLFKSKVLYELLINDEQYIKKLKGVLRLYNKNKYFDTLLEQTKKTNTKEYIQLILKYEATKKVKDIIPFFEHKDPAVQKSAIEAIGELGTNENVKNLLPHLKDKNLETRNNTIKAIIKLGTNENIKDMLLLLKEQYLYEAITIIGALGTAENIKDIIPFLRLPHPLEYVRKITIEAIIKLGTNKNVKDLLPFLKDTDWNISDIAKDLIEKLGTNENVKDLLPLLKDDVVYVKNNAKNLIEKLGTNKNIKDLLPLLKDNDWNISDIAKDLIEKLGTNENVKNLLPLLKDDDLHLRINVIEAIGKLGTNENVKDILPFLKDKNTSVKHSAIEAIGKLGTNENIKDLLPFLKDDDGTVDEAIAAIGKLGTNDNVKDILPFLKDDDGTVKVAIEAIGDIGTNKNIKDLLSFLKNKNDYIKIKAIEAIGDIGTNENIKDLLPFLKNNDWSVKSAIEAIEKLVTNNKKPILEDDDLSVKIKAIEAIGKLGTNKNVKYICPFLKDKNDYVKIKAIEAIGDIGTNKNVKALLPLLKADDWKVKLKAKEIIKKLGTNENVKDILPLLKDSDLNVLVIAKEIIEKLGTNENVKDFIPLLKDDDWKVKLKAKKIIEKLGTNENVKDILPFLKNKNAHKLREMKKNKNDIGLELERAFAIEAIGRLGTNENIKDIFPLLKDKNEKVSNSAIEAIGRLGTNENVKDILPFLKDKNTCVRYITIEAIGKLVMSEN